MCVFFLSSTHRWGSPLWSRRVPTKELGLRKRGIVNRNALFNQVDERFTAVVEENNQKRSRPRGPGCGGQAEKYKQNRYTTFHEEGRDSTHLGTTRLLQKVFVAGFFA